jgi:predicted metalloprotease with PDZ domain
VAAVRYRLAMPEPHTHLLEVEMRLDGVSGPVELVMPSWTPGSYLMREFPRNVQDFSARDAGGQALEWRKLDKNRWRVEGGSGSGAGGTVVARWRVYANELTVRTSHLDATHAHVNGASVFMYAAGREGEPLELEVAAPEGWRISTALEPVGDAVFRAPSFDVLVDSPLEIGTHRLFEWEQEGKPHAFAIWGRAFHPVGTLIEDTKRIVEAASAMFGGLPYPRYLFVLLLAPGGRGGLEHADSTVLLMGRDSFHGEQYESLLALIAHEFFHVWNAKRIRPEPLGPFDYTRENYTRNLWVVEGFTTYYTDLLLVRAGLMKPERYLERLAEAIGRHQALPGRHHQSLEESSFDTWIRFYRPDAHTPNAQVSYYQKGALVALLLDMEIRRVSGGERSLDDLMRVLWERYGSVDVGFPEDPAAGIQALAEGVCGCRLEGFFERYVRGTEELEVERALEVVGLEMRYGGEKTDGERGEGLVGTLAAPHRPADAVLKESRLGVRTTDARDRARVTHVVADSTGWAAGVNSGDEILALDGLRIGGGAELAARVRDRTPGERVALALFRRDELLTVEVEVGPHPAPKLRLTRVEGRNPEQELACADWLRTGPLPSR